ncbi:DNA starvation/stationary phase protection protein [Campylobacter coli]|uniref:Dps family protein n=1 Tax=Campylobacter coli TaxID=195 RepID=UPI00070B9ED7|nr:DNA starvation/stationary phase protection protein [Campylobacter coli]EAK0212341.1 DNA starvation/stationary phase protection protein [Campylobacter jejuni]EAI2216773.1 DNA starvation/stationary phase protection protein [Campylobacter coli]EAJ4519106.1 DNA starvation/stationary phase protection protein [Campylobacter coli]EAK2897003.1 DNA starvation/stationary phase protection protein [Campylobacter coli]EAL4587041.1 DNA starvation/stationary phase protection protein [Campylobacter coli]
MLHKLNATIFSLYVKFSTLHYLVKGEGFEDAHEKTQEYYEKFIEWYDTINERLVQLDKQPLSNLTEIIKKSDIKELSNDVKFYSYLEVYNIIRDDLKILIELCKKCLEELNTLDVVTNDILVEILRYLEKEYWISKSTTINGWSIRNILSVK